jgi:hypothetical protein
MVLANLDGFRSCGVQLPAGNACDVVTLFVCLASGIATAVLVHCSFVPQLTPPYDRMQRRLCGKAGRPRPSVAAPMFRSLTAVASWPSHPRPSSSRSPGSASCARRAFLHPAPGTPAIPGPATTLRASRGRSVHCLCAALTSPGGTPCTPPAVRTNVTTTVALRRLGMAFGERLSFRLWWIGAQLGGEVHSYICRHWAVHLAANTLSHVCLGTVHVVMRIHLASRHNESCQNIREFSLNPNGARWSSLI